MCGIAGILNREGQTPVALRDLRRMLGVISHRGPDESGVFRDRAVGMGNARLSIIDLEGGSQPIHNEDESVWIVFNGEIYNYIELRAELENRGHCFATQGDTEVIVHLYEEHGPECVEHLNGQFAFALWDRSERRLLLARDRVGIRPLFYAERDGALVFGSELKALFASGRVEPAFDPKVLDEIFTYWTPLPGRTAFKGVRSLQPGHVLLAGRGGVTTRRYWSLLFPPAGMEEPAGGAEERAEEFRALLEDATRLRLRADVTVGAYLSGGIDSSTITALTHRSGGDMRTFSIAFSDERYDERKYQDEMIAHLDTRHERIECSASDIGRVFPDVVRHCEIPILRTSPAPMFMLSGLVNDHGIKVVLTGEGADEILGGYNIFRENKVRRFWAREPSSRLRPLLLQRLYGYIPQLQRQSAYLENFFRQGLEETDVPWYSHQIRWENTARLKRFLSEPLRAGAAGGRDELAAILPPEFGRWSPLAKAQYLEMTLFMSEYLLSSQGDRVMMGHSVEGRFPFLDHRVIEFCNRLPPVFKIRGLDEKYLLKKSVEELLPRSQRERAKQPYRAPITASFLGKDAPEYVAELLSPKAIAGTGCFNATAVPKLVEKGEQRGTLSETEEMALVGILSTQLLLQHSKETFSPEAAPESDPARLVEKDLDRA